MSRSRDLEGVHGALNALDLERARLPDRPDFRQTTGALGVRSAPLHRSVLCVVMDCGEPTMNICNCALSCSLKSEPVWNSVQKGKEEQHHQLELNQQLCKFMLHCSTIEL